MEGIIVRCQGASKKFTEFLVKADPSSSCLEMEHSQA